MKAEHRRELHYSHPHTLADRVNQVVHHLKSNSSRTGNAISIILLLGVVIFFGWRYYARSSLASRSVLWREADEATTQVDDANTQDELDQQLTKLDELAQKHSGTLPARMLRFERARILLKFGLERRYAALSRDQAVKQIREAGDLYAQLADESKDTPVLAQEALLGVGKARESLGEVGEALEYYKKLAALYPESAKGKEAADLVRVFEANDNQQKVERLYRNLNELAQPPKDSTPSETKDNAAPEEKKKEPASDKKSPSTEKKESKPSSKKAPAEKQTPPAAKDKKEPSKKDGVQK